MQPSADSQAGMVQAPASMADVRPCTCRNSRCLKLYCVCFQAGLYCADSCKCQECQNTMSSAQAVAEARNVVSLRNPSAFKRVVAPMSAAPCSEPVPPRGCNCRRSKCLKKYCDCFEAGVHCSPEHCRCTDCLNYAGATVTAGSLSNARSGTAPSTSSAPTPEPGEEEDSHMAAAAYMLQQLHQGTVMPHQTAQPVPTMSAAATHAEQPPQNQSETGHAQGRQPHAVVSRQSSLERQGSVVSRSHGSYSDCADQPAPSKGVPYQPAPATSSAAAGHAEDQDMATASGAGAPQQAELTERAQQAVREPVAGSCSSNSGPAGRQPHTQHPQHHTAGRSAGPPRAAVHDSTTASTQRLPHQPPSLQGQQQQQHTGHPIQPSSHGHQPHHPPRHASEHQHPPQQPQLAPHAHAPPQHPRNPHGASKGPAHPHGQRVSHGAPVPTHHHLLPSNPLLRRHSDPHVPPSLRHTQPLPHMPPSRLHQGDAPHSHQPPPPVSAKLSTWPGSAPQQPTARLTSAVPPSNVIPHAPPPHLSTSTQPPAPAQACKPPNVFRDHLSAPPTTTAPPQHEQSHSAPPPRDAHPAHQHPQAHHTPSPAGLTTDLSAKDPQAAGGDATVTVYRITGTRGGGGGDVGGGLTKQPSETFSSTGAPPLSKQQTATVTCSPVEGVAAEGQPQPQGQSQDVIMTASGAGDDEAGVRSHRASTEIPGPAAVAEDKAPLTVQHDVNSTPASISIGGSWPTEPAPVTGADNHSRAAALVASHGRPGPGALARLKQIMSEPAHGRGGLTGAWAQRIVASGEAGAALAELLAASHDAAVTEQEVEVLLMVLHLASVETTGLAPMLRWSADRAHDVQYCAEVAACPRLHTTCRAMGLQLVACLSNLLPQQYPINLLHHDAVKRALSVSLSNSEPLSLQLASLAVAAISPTGVMDELDMAFAATVQRLAATGLASPAAWQADVTAPASLSIPGMPGAALNPAAKLLLKTSGAGALFTAQAPEAADTKTAAAAAAQLEPAGSSALSDRVDGAASENAGRHASDGGERQRRPHQHLSAGAAGQPQSAAQCGQREQQGQGRDIRMSVGGQHYPQQAMPSAPGLGRLPRPQQVPVNHMVPLNLSSPRHMGIARPTVPGAWPAVGNLRWPAAGQLACSSISPRQQKPPVNQLAWDNIPQHVGHSMPDRHTMPAQHNAPLQHQLQPSMEKYMEMCMEQHLRSGPNSMPVIPRSESTQTNPGPLSDPLVGHTHTLDLSTHAPAHEGLPYLPEQMALHKHHPTDTHMMDVPPPTPGAGQAWSNAFPFPSPPGATRSPHATTTLTSPSTQPTADKSTSTDEARGIPTQVNQLQHPLPSTAVPPPHPDIRRRLDGFDDRTRMPHASTMPQQQLQPSMSALLPSQHGQATVPPPCQEVAQRMQVAAVNPSAAHNHAARMPVLPEPSLIHPHRSPLRYTDDLPANADGMVVVYPVQPLKHIQQGTPISVVSAHTHLTSDPQHQTQVQHHPQELQPAVVSASNLTPMATTSVATEGRLLRLQAEMPSVSSPAEPRPPRSKQMAVGPVSPSHATTAALLQPDADGRMTVPPADQPHPAAHPGAIAVPPPTLETTQLAVPPSLHNPQANNRPLCDSQITKTIPTASPGQVCVPPPASTLHTHTDVHTSVPSLSLNIPPHLPTIAVSPSTPIVAVGPPVTTSVPVGPLPMQPMPTLEAACILSPSAALHPIQVKPAGTTTSETASQPAAGQAAMAALPDKTVRIQVVASPVEQSGVLRPSFSTTSAGTGSEQAHHHHHHQSVPPAGTWLLNLAERPRNTPAAGTPPTSNPPAPGHADLATLDAIPVQHKAPPPPSSEDAPESNPLLDLAEQAAAEAEAEAKAGSIGTRAAVPAAVTLPTRNAEQAPQPHADQDQGHATTHTAASQPLVQGHAREPWPHPVQHVDRPHPQQQQHQAMLHAQQQHQKLMWMASQGWQMPGSQLMMGPDGLTLVPAHPGMPDMRHSAAQQGGTPFMFGPGGSMPGAEASHQAVMGYPSNTGPMQAVQPSMFMGMPLHPGVPLMHMPPGAYIPYMGGGAGMMPHMSGMMMMPQEPGMAWRGGQMMTTRAPTCGDEGDRNVQGVHRPNAGHGGHTEETWQGQAVLGHPSHGEHLRMVGSKAAPDDSSSAPFKRLRSQTAGDVAGTHVAGHPHM